MGRYILKRILYFIPTLVLISLLAFIISIQAPGDPVDRLLNTSSATGEMLVESELVQQQRMQLRERLGLHLPVFYVSFSSLSQPATLPPALRPDEQQAFRRIVHTMGNNALAGDYYKSLQHLYQLHQDYPATSEVGSSGDSLRSGLQYSAASVKALLQEGNAQRVQDKLQELLKLYTYNIYFKPLQDGMEEVVQSWQKGTTNPSLWRNYIPVIRWHGDNQYHRWLLGDGNWLTGKGSTYQKGWIRGDMGTSYTTQLPVRSVIASRIGWSLFFTFSSVLLAYLISVPIGMKAAAARNSFFDRSSSVLLFLLYSMPAFWVATLLLMNFANPDVIRLFPSSGVAPTGGIPEGSSWWEWLRITLPYLVLPTICYTYAQLAFLSRITRVAALEVLQQDYIRTARAKGLSEGKVLYRHAFRNALLPVITVFANVFPAAIGGSVILETIFTIPGMGRAIIEAIYQEDYPMIVSVFTLTGVLTLCGYLLADILYAMTDPRISWKK